MANAFLLKREWLQIAKRWEKNAKDWAKGLKKGISGWNTTECANQVAAYTKWADDAKISAEKAPVKIVLHYADGTTKVIE